LWLIYMSQCMRKGILWHQNHKIRFWLILTEKNTRNQKIPMSFFYLPNLYIKFDVENTSKLTITSKLGAILFWRQNANNMYLQQ
jgi:hypothetical protein